MENYILAKDRLNEILKDQKYEIIEEFKGSKIVGKKYKPLFNDYSKNEKLKNRDNGWRIYEAPFVTVEEGTGIVHIAPAFGEKWFKDRSGKPYAIRSTYWHGRYYKKEVEKFAGLQVKPIDDVQKTDVEIIKDLAARNLLFSKEKYEHSYPHCWRCETPLLNYATSSWFVAVTKIKDQALTLSQGN